MTGLSFNPARVIEQKRDIIEQEFRQQFTAKKIQDLSLTDNDLQYLLDLYDREFFDGSLRKYFIDNGITFDFIFGNETKAGGYCAKKGQCNYTISFPLPVFRGIFNKDSADVERVNGLLCSNRLRCLMIVLEHELVHLLIFMLAPPQKQHHGTLFRDITRGLFGHTNFRHGMGLGETEGTEEAKARIRVGDRVKIIDPKTKEIMEFVVTKINPGARGSNFKGYRVNDPKKAIYKAVPYGLVIRDDAEDDD